MKIRNKTRTTMATLALALAGCHSPGVSPGEMKRATAMCAEYGGLARQEFGL